MMPSSIAGKRLFLTLLLTLGCILYALLANVGYTDDFRAFYLAAEAAVHHLDPYRNHDNLGSVFADPLWPWPDSRFVYPPSSLFFFLPLALLPYGIAKVLFGITTAICTAAAMLLLRARLRTPDILWALLFFSMPVFMCIDNGQIECHLLLLLLAAFLLGDSAFAGVLWGLAIAVKLAPVLLVFWFAGARRWKVVACGFLTTAVLSFAAWLVWGADFFKEFYQHLQRHAVWNALPVTPHLFGDLQVIGNRVITTQATYTLSYEFFGWFQNPLRHLHHAAQAAGLCAVLATAAFLFLTVRGRRFTPLLSFCIFLAATPLANPLLWPMGLVACLPLTGVLLSVPERRVGKAILLLVPLFAPKIIIGNHNYAVWLTGTAFCLFTLPDKSRLNRGAPASLSAI